MCFTGFVEPTEAEDYHALTEREQQDLDKLMSQCGFAISNAEAFMEMIARDLSVLDGVRYLQRFNYMSVVNFL